MLSRYAGVTRRGFLMQALAANAALGLASTPAAAEDSARKAQEATDLPYFDRPDMGACKTLHFRPEGALVGDVSFFRDGREYHLFYLSKRNDDPPRLPRTAIAHAVSRDGRTILEGFAPMDPANGAAAPFAQKYLNTAGLGLVFVSEDRGCRNRAKAC